jgi:hypothetical protein
MLIIELIFLILAIFVYQSALFDNMEKIELDTNIYQTQISDNFISQINTHYSNVESDILMVAKHGYPMYLTQNDITNRPYFYFNKNSEMYEELKKLNPFETPKENTNLMKDLISQAIKNQNQTQYNFDEALFMEELLSKNELNYVFRRTDNVDRRPINEDITIYLNYLIPIMKSILIRNAIYEKENNVYLNFQIYLDNNAYKFSYPNNKQNDPYFSDPVYNETENKDEKTTCKNREDNKVIFDDIKIKNEQLISRGCLKLDFGKNINYLNSFICLEFTFNNYLENIRIPNYKKSNYKEYFSMFIFNKKKNKNELDMYFSSIRNISLLKEESLIDNLLNEFEREMEDNKKKDFAKNITDYITDFENKLTLFNQNNSTVLNTKLELSIIMKKQTMDIFDVMQNKINVTIIPIYSSEKLIDRENFVFIEECENKIFKKPMGYFLISALFGVNIKILNLSLILSLLNFILFY